MNLNKLRTTLQKVSSIRNLITIFILLLSISSASAVPMRIWNTVFYDNYPTSTQVQWAQQMHADVILIPEDVITTSMITQFKNAGFSVWLGLDPVLNHATGQTFDITNPTIRAQRIQYVKDLVNANLGISGIQYEELQTGNVASMNDFLTQTTNFLRPKGIYVTFNIAQMNPPFTNLGFDLTYIDSQRLVDAVFLQIGDRGLSASKDAYNQWNGYMPNTLIVPYAYGWTGSQPITTELFTVIDYFNTRGMSVSITQTDMNSIALNNYPELKNLNPNYVLSPSDTIAVVIGRIPIAGVVVTPTPVPTPVPTGVTPTPAPIPTSVGANMVTITSNPIHADIFIDGSNADTGYTPNTLTLTPGTHNIRLVLPNYPDITDTITVASGQSLTRNYQFTTSVPTPTPTPTPTPSSTNLISNPGFESGTSSWTFYTSGIGTFTIASPGFEGTKAAKLALSSGGTNIQLYRTGIKLEPGTRYRLTFAAYSSTGHDVTVRLFKHISPYNTYAPDFKANLGTKWQTFTTEFTTTGFTATVNDGRLMFWLAPFAAKGDIFYIDNVRLEKVN